MAICGLACASGAAWTGAPEVAAAAGNAGKSCATCSPGAGTSGGDAKAELVIGCLSDADCGEQGLCVKGEDASDDDAGDCVLSADDLSGEQAGEQADEPGPGSTTADAPKAQLQCSQSPGGAPAGPLAIAILAGLNALALLRIKRRVPRRRG